MIGGPSGKFLAFLLFLSSNGEVLKTHNEALFFAVEVLLGKTPINRTSICSCYKTGS